MPIVVAWSGGKDSTLALARLVAAGGWRIVSLLTTIDQGFDRIVMHGVRRRLLEDQARALEIPLQVVELPPRPSNQEYDALMGSALARMRDQGIAHVAFGDLYLEEVRRYREDALADTGMEGVFPLWGEPTAPLAEEFIASGYRAIVTCVDTRQLDGAFAGSWFDQSFLSRLPPGVDPCGENGEFHTFVTAGPGFSSPLPCRSGVRVLRENRFMYCDLLE